MTENEKLLQITHITGFYTPSHTHTHTSSTAVLLFMFAITFEIAINTR
jgi:hypothetical protein